MKKKIFVIDDDSLALKLIVAALEAEGYEVKAFSEFDALVKELRQSLPDLVMTDVVMPKVSGFEVCSKVKEMFQPHPPPVIVMTGKLDAIDPIQARRMGADDFVVKTSDMAILTQAVQKILSGKK
jgi:two-component system response regulator ChvI